MEYNLQNIESLCGTPETNMTLLINCTSIKYRLDDTEEQIRKLEGKVVEITQAEQKKINEDSLKCFWDTSSTLTCYKGPGRRREQERDK